MKETIRTYCTPEKYFEQIKRCGFKSIDCYGSVAPEKDEIGGIFKKLSHPIINEIGLWVQSGQLIERIFIK